MQATHRNPAAFSDFQLPFNVAATTSAATALQGASFIVHAIPVQQSYEFLEGVRELVPADTPIISLSKGLHVQRMMMMSELIPAALGRPEQPTAFVSGPTFAEELMRGYPSGEWLLVGSRDHTHTKSIRGVVHCLFTDDMS